MPFRQSVQGTIPIATKPGVAVFQGTLRRQNGEYWFDSELGNAFGQCWTVMYKLA